MAEERALRPIYNAIDSHNYTKAIKLCSSKPSCDWAIVLSLKAHALERCGRTLESLEVLRALLVQREGCEGMDWSELEERIWVWRVTTSPEEQEKSSSVSLGSNSNATASSKPKKGAGKKGKSSSQSKQGNSAAKSVVSQHNSLVSSELDMIDILDMSVHERREIIRTKALISKDSKTVGTVQDIVDEVGFYHHRPFHAI